MWRKGLCNLSMTKKRPSVKLAFPKCGISNDPLIMDQQIPVISTENGSRIQLCFLSLPFLPTSEFVWKKRLPRRLLAWTCTINALHSVLLQLFGLYIGNNRRIFPTSLSPPPSPFPPPHHPRPLSVPCPLYTVCMYIYYTLSTLLRYLPTSPLLCKFIPPHPTFLSWRPGMDRRKGKMHQ